MSTAGKVLVVLSVLMMAVWVVLVAAVAQLNTNANQTLAKLQADVGKLQADVDQAEQNALDLRERINVEQVAKERSLYLVRTRLAKAEATITGSQADLSQLKIQIDNYTKALASAREDLNLRNREKADLEKAKADEESTVNRIKGENAELLGRLTQLRADFQETLRKNTSEVQAQIKGGRKPAGRPASLSR